MLTSWAEEVNESPLRTAGLVGTGMALGAWTASVGPPPLDAVLDWVLWFFYALLALAGAFFGVSAVLAWRHVRESSWWLLGTLLGLLLFSQPAVSAYVRESREMQRFLATADSTQGVVADKYVRGSVNLVVEYQVGRRTYRARKRRPTHWWGPQSFSEWQRGDSIWVYYQPAAPKTVLAGYRSPDRHALFESLALTWSVWGLLLTAYLPPIARGVLRGLAAVRTWLQSVRD